MVKSMCQIMSVGNNYLIKHCAMILCGFMPPRLSCIPKSMNAMLTRKLKNGPYQRVQPFQGLHLQKHVGVRMFADVPCWFYQYLDMLLTFMIFPCSVAFHTQSKPFPWQGLWYIDFQAALVLDVKNYESK
jgi:hypothetical protein